MKHYKQLTYEQRCQIEAYKKSGFTQAEIAAAIGVSQSTISRELARNTGQRGYRYNQAQRLADARRERTRRATKMTSELNGTKLSPFGVSLFPDFLSCKRPRFIQKGVGFWPPFHAARLNPTRAIANDNADNKATKVVQTGFPTS